MNRLRQTRRGSEATGPLWPEIRRAFGWGHQAAHLLANQDQVPAEQVEQRFKALTETMGRDREQAGALNGGVDHFLKLTTSSHPGLVHCDRVPDLPRTNNGLEQLFGAHRCHDRRATGRKIASPALVLRGPVRLLAATATRLPPFTAHDLAGIDRPRWTALRRSLDDRRHLRILRTRFRRHPEAYLAQLECRCLQPALPP